MVEDPLGFQQNVVYKFSNSIYNTIVYDLAAIVLPYSSSTRNADEAVGMEYNLYRLPI